MQEIKHTRITEDLRKGILNGKYGGKLPPYRMLVKEYGVSMQTIAKAVRPLSDNGLIVPGPRGSMIGVFGEKRPKYFAWGVLNRGTIERGDNGGLKSLSIINSILGRGGYNVVYLDARNERMRTDPEFWKRLPVDGVVFSYGTLTRELALSLRRHGIAAVTLHWADELPVNVVEWDTFGAVGEVVESLLKLGYRRIALQLAYPLEGYQDYANAQWSAIREQYGIAYPEYRENVMPGNADNRERHTEYLCLSTPPEVILCWHAFTKETFGVLKRHGLADRVRLVSYESPFHSDTSFMNMLTGPDESILWEEIRKILMEKYEHPEDPFIHRLTPYHPVFINSLPPKKG